MNKEVCYYIFILILLNKKFLMLGLRPVLIAHIQNLEEIAGMENTQKTKTTIAVKSINKT